jgi:hypothetical protein
MRPAFQRAEWEVARIIEAPVSLLADPAVVKREIRRAWSKGSGATWTCPYFDIDGEKVWGATAMVLAEFCAILKLVKAVHCPRRRVCADYCRQSEAGGAAGREVSGGRDGCRRRSHGGAIRAVRC